MELYRYQPLSRDNDEIRLLQLLPGSWDSPIKTRLAIEPFQYENYVPKYEAVSYAWGDPQDVMTIDVLHGKQHCALPVTRQCSEALRHLRLRKKPRRLWIDAVCIDQSNLYERAQQVKCMGWIFKNASRVLAWAGPASETSDVASNYIADCAAINNDQYWFGSETNDSEWLEMHMQASRVIKPDVLSALNDFFRRPWFKRLWIWPEVYYAQECILMCGKLAANFGLLAPAYFKITLQPFHGHPEYRALLQCLEGVHDLFFVRSKRGSNILRTLYGMKGRECLDHRDRVYVAQVLDGNKSNIKIEPDYTKSVADIYRDAVASYMKHSNDLNFLSHASNASVIDGLPTWVPDWSIENGLSFNKFSGPSIRLRGAVRGVNNERLRVLGVPVSTIHRVNPFGIDSEFWPLSKEDIDMMESCIRQAVGYVLRWDEHTNISRNKLYTLCDTLCAGFFSDEDFVAENFASRELCLAVLSGILNLRSEHPDNPSPWAADVARRALIDHCRCRSLFMSDDGHLGLAPEDTEPDDLLVALLGVNGLLLIRRSLDDTYTVIGTAYCGTINNGEPFLGELPNSFEVAWTRNPEDRTSCETFRCIETGHMQYVDPRLPPLSDDWEAESYMQGDIKFLRYRNIITGEVRGYKEDPRYDNIGLLCDKLRLESFTLV